MWLGYSFLESVFNAMILQKQFVCVASEEVGHGVCEKCHEVLIADLPYAWI